jgi:hypothetical protein
MASSDAHPKAVPAPADSRERGRHRMTWIAVVLWVAFGIAALLNAYPRPALNWDIIPYAASALSIEFDEFADVHATVYDELRTVAGKRKFEQMITGSYREAVYGDPAVLEEQLPFYQPRVLYIGAIYVLHKAGVGILQSTYGVSLIAFALSLVMIVFLMRGALGPLQVIALAAYILAFGGLWIAKASTPDAMAMLVVLASVLAILEKSRIVLVLLPVMVAVRTDLIIWAVLLSVFLSFDKRHGRIEIGAALLSALVVLVALNEAFGNYGWQTLFYFTFIKLVPHPAALEDPLTLRMYLNVLERGATHALQNTPFRFYACIAAVLGAVYAKLGLTRVRASNELADTFAIWLLCMIYVIVHFVLFPTFSQRFFEAFYVLNFIALLMVVTRLASTARSPAPP